MLLLLLLSMQALAGIQVRAEVQDRSVSHPNVILLVMDATRADYLSVYGHPNRTSAAIDRIASQGVRFDQCIAAASWTLPSMASFFTGLHTRHHNVTSRNLVLRPSYTTLAEKFRDAGYRTRGISCNVWVGDFSGLEQGFEDTVAIWRDTNALSIDAGAASANRAALQWIDSLSSKDPFFLYIHYMEPHFPYRPPQPFDRLFTNPGTSAAVLEKVRCWKSPRELGFILKEPSCSIQPAELKVLQAQYEGEIAYLDQKIGELTTELSRRDLLDGLILIITADHGEHVGDHHLLDHKMSVYDAVIRVPLIIRYPPRIQPGTTIRRQVQTIDLFPTLSTFCGLVDTETDGIPLIFKENPDLPARTTFTEFARPLLFIDVIERNFPLADYSPIDRSLLAVRTERYKLIRASDGRHELFDLRADPREERNLFGQLPEEAGRLMKEAERFLESDPE